MHFSPKSILSASFLLVCAAFSFWVSTPSQSSNQGQASLSSRNPRSASSPVDQWLDEVDSMLQNGSLTREQCSSKLSALHARVDQLEFKDLNLPEVKSRSADLLSRAFRTHLRLRQQMSDWQQEGRLSDPENQSDQDCIWAFRRVFRTLRVMTDYLAEGSENFPFERRFSEVNGKKVEKVIPAFEGGSHFLLWNEKFGQPGQTYTPESGDVIISRGMASTSAAIARITDEDANFSHLTIVYVDPKTKEVQTVEAHIEIGSHVFKWAQYVGDGKARAAVFRFRDPKRDEKSNRELAHQAASFIKDQVGNYVKKHGSGICYDFGMDMKDRKCYFCSEIVSVAFGQFGVQLPWFESPIRPKNTGFLDSLGVTARQTFAPADIELDSRFEFVAEWRDVNRIHGTHHMDAILASMFKWMDEENYSIRTNAKHDATSIFGYTLRRIPLLERFVNEKFPLNMPRKTIATVQALNDITNAMGESLLAEEQGLERRPARLLPHEMRAILERNRLNELTGKEVPPNFRYHSLFGPNK